MAKDKPTVDSNAFQFEPNTEPFTPQTPTLEERVKALEDVITPQFLAELTALVDRLRRK